jgi:peptide/nickel transport system permease protein
MLRFIAKRLLLMIPIVLGVIFIVYLISYLAPGDPVFTMLGDSYTPERYITLQKQLGIDKPFIVQYFNYIKNVFLHFDFGMSYSYRLPVAREIVSRAPFSIRIGLLSIAFTIVLGIPIGIISATKQRSAADYTVTMISMFFAGMPNFWFALMLMLLFANQLHWLPATGYTTWKHWVLPVLSLGFTTMASVIRMTRSSILEVIRQDYVRTARAKGLSNIVVTYKHVLKNALIPVVTVIGMQLSNILAGSIIVETIFNMPGIGSYIMKGISSRDFPIINGCVVVLSVCVCLVNILVDILYAYLDPRIKAQYEIKRRGTPKLHIRKKEGVS